MKGFFGKFLTPCLLVFIVLTLFYSKSAFAATIYSNNFTFSVTDFLQFFGTCSPSSNGLSCDGNNGILYSSSLPGIACVSASFTNPSSIYSSLFLVDSNSSWLDNPVALRTNYNNHISIDTGNTSLGAANSSNLTPSGKHTYMLCKSNNTFTGYVDNVPVVSYLETGHNPISFAISDELSVPVTNLVISDTLPTITPTPTITPSPTPVQLNVPQLKQTSNPWQSQLYDSANKWSPGNTNINTWGCAITSASMILQYNGITKMPDNSPLNPGTLNTWLKSQKDGYIGNGLVNWLALQRFTQIAKLAFNNPHFTADALEYKRIGNPDKITLANDIQNKQADILEEPNHFVVATGIKGTTFSINDPYFSRDTLNNGYNNTFLSLGRFIPSHTDLSYILLTGPASLDFDMKNSSGSAVGEQFIQQPIENPANPSILSGLPIKLFYLTQPKDDKYTLSISNKINGTYNAQAYIYDIAGNVQIFDLTGSGTQNGTDTFAITYTKTKDKQNSIRKKSIFDIILTDTENFCSQNQIKKDNCHELRKEINDANDQYDKKHFFSEKIKLAEALIKLILGNNNHNISDNAYQLLVTDITFLLTH